MKKLFTIVSMTLIIPALTSCGGGPKGDMPWIVDRFDDIKVIRYEVPGFDALPLEEKELIYYLSEAAKCGRDILFDQNCPVNLPVRRTLEVVYENYAGDRTTAEDLLHDAFLKIYGAFDRFTYRGTGSLRAWIERITVNVALEWIRSCSKLGSVTLDEGKAAAEVAEPDVAEMARVPREVLMRFIGELPEGYRAVFNLYCIEEYSHRDIARMLGINEKSSSSQLFRARAMLARRIRAYLETH